MGDTLRSILTRLVAYVAVLIAAGLLLLAGATVYELMWPRARGPVLANEPQSLADGAYPKPRPMSLFLIRSTFNNGRLAASRRTAG
jgi:hypothetical protein